MLNNGCNDFLFGVHCVEDRDRIPTLQSYGQALKQKNCFSGVLGDDCGASAIIIIIIILPSVGIFPSEFIIIIIIIINTGDILFEITGVVLIQVYFHVHVQISSFDVTTERESVSVNSNVQRFRYLSFKCSYKQMYTLAIWKVPK